MNIFKNIKNPTVLGEVDVYDFLDRIKNPEIAVLQKINEARVLYSTNKSKYDYLKSELPCFTLNFDFNIKKLNSNIKNPTGFIYIDIDGTTDIQFDNEYIFATWLSLSGNGRGVLVKVDGLTLENFRITYSDVTKLLNIESDDNANKATQFCVHSYDSNIYINNDSTAYKPTEVIKNSHNTVLTIKKGEKVNTEIGENKKLRFNNISDYDFQGEDYLVFWGDKEIISQVFIPKIITIGMRETVLSSVANQIKALNSEITKDELLHFISNVNKKRCLPPLKNNEVMRIVDYKINSNDVEPILNHERRIFFNPDCKLTRLEKTTITNQTLGKLKEEKSRTIIRECIINWDYVNNGKITQHKLAKISGLNIRTIEKYYKEFRELISENRQYSLC